MSRTPYERRDDWIKANPFKRRVYNLIRSTRIRAKIRGLPHDLDAAWLEPIMQRGICQATGIPFVIDGSRGPFTPTVDRQIPAKGYTRDNVKIVVLIHNLA